MRAQQLERPLRSAWLCCPHCGASKHLRQAEDLPSGVTHILSPCPDCDAHFAVKHENDKGIHHEH
jgi:hypothetical protein